MMAKEIRFVKDEIGERLEELASHPDTVMLKFPGHLVSDRPIQSEDYANCNGVVLLNHHAVGLSHYDLRSNPEVYLPQLIKEILAVANAKGLSAVLVGGDINHFQKNRSILEKYGIPVVGAYCDGLMDGERLTVDLHGRDSTKADKQLVVIPSTQEVLMYSQPVGHIRLTPLKA